MEGLTREAALPRFFNPPTIWKPFSAFSMGVVQGDGRIVHLKGQVPLDLDGQVASAPTTCWPR